MIKKHVVTSKQTKILKEKLNNLSLFTSIQLFLVDIFFIQKLLISGQQDIYSSSKNSLYTLFYRLIQ